MRFRNVLVVDDCCVTRCRIVKELSAVGYIVRTAPDGLTALQMLRESCPDFVITDWQMPNIDGDVVCRCIRAEQHPHYIYVILMTAYDEDLGLAKGLGAGADDYITKPVDPRDLIAHMESGARVLELDRRLTYVAQHDPLTGTLNRVNLVNGLAAELEVNRRRNRPVACIMLDLDFFKQVNEKFGHLAGDNVLLNVSNVLRSQFRNSDYVCRYGGEEFCILLPNCDEKGAAVCADRCRAEIETLRIGGLPDDFHITASFGVAESTETMTPSQLLDHSDEAMLAAKRNGRNTVVQYSQLDDKKAENDAEPAATAPAVAPTPLASPSVPVDASDSIGSIHSASEANS